jgi:hypothetical protein
MTQEPQKSNTFLIVIAIVGVVGTVVASAIGAIGNYNTEKLRQEAEFTRIALASNLTHTAEASKALIANTPNVTTTSTPTFTLAPTFIPTPTVTLLIDGMDKLSNWKPSFCDEKCGGSNGKSSIIDISLVSGRANDANGALEISYDVKNSGYVIITKNIVSQRLLGTTGISFFYKGSGAPNTIEFKLLLRYPGDSEDTAFGASWNRVTDTSDNWTPIEALYSTDFTCWWPANLCQTHGETPDLKVVKRIDFAISNKPTDKAGTGKVAFDDLAGIQP